MPTIERKPVRVYVERLRCECGGEMRNDNGFCFTTQPPIYPHKCDRCGVVHEVRGKRYPRHVFEFDMVYEDIEP